MNSPDSLPFDLYDCYPLDDTNIERLLVRSNSPSDWVVLETDDHDSDQSVRAWSVDSVWSDDENHSVEDTTDLPVPLPLYPPPSGHTVFRIPSAEGINSWFGDYEAPEDHDLAQSPEAGTTTAGSDSGDADGWRESTIDVDGDAMSREASPLSSAPSSYGSPPPSFRRSRQTTNKPRSSGIGRQSRFRCECHGILYGRLGDLERHLKEASKPYVCRGCSMSFKRAEPRTRHWNEALKDSETCEVLHHFQVWAMGDSVEWRKESRRWQRRWTAATSSVQQFAMESVMRRALRQSKLELPLGGTFELDTGIETVAPPIVKPKLKPKSKKHRR